MEVDPRFHHTLQIIVLSLIDDHPGVSALQVALEHHEAGIRNETLPDVRNKSGTPEGV